MKTAHRWALRAGVALCAAAATYLGHEQRAEALLDTGVEAGAAQRSNTNVGLAAGAHFELNPIAGLFIGPYYLHLSAKESDPPHPTHDSVKFETVGGRVRYIFTMLSKEWQPFVLAGVGYTWVNYPTYSLEQPAITNPTMSSSQLGTLDERGMGHFVEVPLGVGIAYQPFRPVRADLGFTYRPAFSFGGEPYDAPAGREPFAQPKHGWSLTLGISLDI